MLNGQRLGRYLLEDLLKHGGMADVYRGRDLETNRAVAVKILPALLARDADFVARFKNEVVQVRKLAHPNIVPIESFGEQGPWVYFVMPLLDASLRDLLLRQGKLDPSRAIDIAMQIASALMAVHALGLVHRDIKPDNILLRDDRALLTDFGIVRQIEFGDPGRPPTLAGSGLPIGTPQYMAPEQLACRPVDPRADLYALGAVLYESLTGQPPHGAGTPYPVAIRALTDPIPPPSGLNPAIPPELDAVALRALARAPADRYATASEMRNALQGVADKMRGARRTLPPTWPSPTRAVGEEPERRAARPGRLIALAALLLMVSSLCGLSLVMNSGARGPVANGGPSSSPTLPYDPIYEGLAATATVYALTPTVTTGPHTPTPTPRPPLPTRTPTPRPPTKTVGPGTPTLTPYPTDTPAPTATPTPLPTATPTVAPTATPTDIPTATPTP